MSTTIVLCSDLIFSTKINSTAKSLAVDVRSIFGGDAKREDEFVDRILVDLDCPAASVHELERIRTLYPHPARLIAFGPHVDVEKLRTARRIGADLVLPRSEFSKRLVEILQSSDAENLAERPENPA